MPLRIDDISPAPITQPNSHYMRPVIDAYLEIEKSIGLTAQFCEQETQNELKHWQEINQQKSEMLHEQSQKLQARQMWSVIENVVQYIATSSSIIFGATLFSAGQVIPGGFLIAAGSIGLINRATSDLGGWQWVASRVSSSNDQQRKIASYIDIGFTSLSTVITLATVIGVYHTGAIHLMAAGGRDEIMKQFIKVVGIASTVMGTTAHFGKALTEKKMYIINGEIKQSDTESLLARLKIENNITNQCNDIESLRKIAEPIKAAIANLR